VPDQPPPPTTEGRHRIWVVGAAALVLAVAAVVGIVLVRGSASTGSSAAPAATTAAAATTPAGAPTAGSSAPLADPSAPTRCRSGLVPVSLRIPQPNEVGVNVLNASGADGLELTVLVDLGQRGFQMLSTTAGLATNDNVAIIRYGPRTLGAGWLLRAYLLDQAVPEFDRNRSDDRVDVVLGKRYRGLGTPAEVNQALAQLGVPALPPGTCDEAAR
jgi:hypothetical protein